MDEGNEADELSQRYGVQCDLSILDGAPSVVSRSPLSNIHTTHENSNIALETRTYYGGRAIRAERYHLIRAADSVGALKTLTELSSISVSVHRRLKSASVL